MIIIIKRQKAEKEVGNENLNDKYDPEKTTKERREEKREYDESELTLLLCTSLE